ncbi:hypothetical protein SGPA1_12173 [Streptomyces misionensis JCM 4497]
MRGRRDHPTPSRAHPRDRGPPARRGARLRARHRHGSHRASRHRTVGRRPGEDRPP